MRDRLLAVATAAGWLALASPSAAQMQVVTQPAPPPAAVAGFERVTFEQAVSRAVEHHPTVGEAAQAILRAQALLDQSNSVFRPSLYGNVNVVTLDAARGFNGFETVPRTQTAWSATLGFQVLNAAGWAAKSAAADQVEVAKISAEETRRQVATTAAQAYLAVIAAERQREIAIRNLTTAQALEDYAKARLDAGKGSRLNHVRSTQERGTAELQLELAELLVRQAQEALGVAVFAQAPLDANGDPDLRPAPPPTSDAWLMQRPDVRLFSSQTDAAERVAHDAWRAWLPTGNVLFAPQYLNPKGGFAPAKTWTLTFEFQLPIFDSTIGPARRAKYTDFESSRYRFDQVKLEARAEQRLAQDTVTRREQMVVSSRVSSEAAAEALHISQIAYEAGATSNIEVVQAQQAARNTEIALAVSEDRLRQSRLDLLVSLGLFP
jgi:outer membrane protein